MLMKKNWIKVLSLFLIIVLNFSGTMVFGQSKNNLMSTKVYQQSLKEAKNYLKNYKETNYNELGKKFTTEYIFKSNSDLDGIASYIAEYGYDAFNDEVENAINEIVSNEIKSSLITPMSTNPTTAYATISGNGTHTVSADTSGLATFNTLGTVEYIASLSYRINVSNGIMTGLSSISFDIPYLSASGSWGGLSLQFYNTTTSAGVTANYTISKTLSIPIGDYEFEIRTETDNEFFALLTNLQ